MTDQTKIKFLDRDPPRFSKEDAEQIAGDLFDLSGEFSSLRSERDQNFRIKPQNGVGYVLKISNSEEDAGVIDLQCKALVYIEEQDSALPIPRVIDTKRGDPFTFVEDAKGTQHLVRVLTYLPGVLLDEVSRTPGLWRSQGSFIGRLDLAMRGFFHTHARQAHPWDIMRSVELRPHTSHIADSADRMNVEQVLDTMQAEILPRLRRLRHQVIHADAHAQNMLTDAHMPQSITGILDFGDMVFAPLVTGIAIAADLERAAPDELMMSLCALVAGYDRVIPLEEDEIDLIYDLVLARLAATSAIIAWRKEMTPDQPAYLHEYEAPCLESIANLLRIGREKVRDELRAACRFPSYSPINAEVQSEENNEALLARRQRVLGPGLSLFYSEPLHIERGRGVWLYNAQGKAYLDAYNNVPVVGHCHTHVVQAIARQSAALNINTRYLYRSILDYAERLVSLFPGDLSVCLFVNSGSEAVDIAWRMAQSYTGQRGALVMEDAYHGITEATWHLSTSKMKNGLATHVQTLLTPDPYRGKFRHGVANIAELYAADAQRAIGDLHQGGIKPAAFIVDTAFASNGIPDVPKGYLAAVSEMVHLVGGLLIADEIQAGFGRMGTHWWGYMGHALNPDIVTLGKPVGNGYPLGVIVTRPEILSTLVDRTSIFSSYGGNPVACAAGMATIDVIENEDLIDNAARIGGYLREGLRALMPRHDWIGDVRGMGLLIAVELVRDRTTLEPAREETQQILDLMRENGVLIGSEGRLANVLKIRPPLIFTREHADLLIDALDRSLAAL